MKNGNQRRRAAENNLFGAKRIGGVEACSANCGQEAGKGGHRQQQERNDYEGHWVRRGNTEKLALQDSSGESSSHDSDDHTRECRLQPLKQDHPVDVRTPRAQRHANADFSLPLRHAV